MSRSARAIALAVLVPLLVGWATILTRHEGSPNPNLQVRGDATHYLQLAQGVDPATVIVPFRYRVLVPWLAGKLPLPAHQALQLVSLVSLIGVLVLLARIGASLGIEKADVVTTLVSLAAMPAVLYVFHNPFLIDFFGLLMITGAFYALIARRPLLFIALVTVGTAARESVLFIAPAYLLTAWIARAAGPGERKGVLALGILLPVLAFLVPRLLPALGPSGMSGYSGFYESTLRELRPLRDPVHFIVSVAMAWQWLWFAALGGLALLGTSLAPPALRAPGGRWAMVSIRVAFLLLTTGGLLTLVANGVLDADRQMLIVAPALVAATMVFSFAMRQVVREEVYGAGVLSLLICALSSAWVRLPNRLFSEPERWSAPLWLLTSMSLCIIALCLARLARAGAAPVVDAC